jgi:hypothetical protein
MDIHWVSFREHFIINMWFTRNQALMGNNIVYTGSVRT